MTIKDTLEQRQKTHGNFEDHADLAQALKAECSEAAHSTKVGSTCSAPVRYYRGLDAVQAESLDMILHKIARIIVGDPSEADHWHDIAGYATLVEQHNRKIQPPREAPPTSESIRAGVQKHEPQMD